MLVEVDDGVLLALPLSEDETDAEGLLDPEPELLAELVSVDDDDELAVDEDDGVLLGLADAELLPDEDGVLLEELELEPVLESDVELEYVGDELDELDAVVDAELLGE